MLENKIDLLTSLKMLDNIYENEFEVNDTSKALISSNNANKSAQIVKSVNFLI